MPVGDLLALLTLGPQQGTDLYSAGVKTASQTGPPWRPHGRHYEKALAFVRNLSRLPALALKRWQGSSSSPESLLVPFSQECWGYSRPLCPRPDAPPLRQFSATLVGFLTCTTSRALG